MLLIWIFRDSNVRYLVYILYYYTESLSCIGLEYQVCAWYDLFTKLSGTKHNLNSNGQAIK